MIGEGDWTSKAEDERSEVASISAAIFFLFICFRSRPDVDHQSRSSALAIPSFGSINEVGFRLVAELGKGGRGAEQAMESRKDNPTSIFSNEQEATLSMLTIDSGSTGSSA